MIQGSSADYASLDSREKAWRAVERGEIVAILMLPEMFGGQERDENTIFVPEAIAARKDEIDETVILPLVRAGKPIEYSVEPENDKRSFVPVALSIRAFAPEPIVYRLAIWPGSGG